MKKGIRKFRPGVFVQIRRLMVSLEEEESLSGIRCNMRSGGYLRPRGLLCLKRMLGTID